MRYFTKAKTMPDQQAQGCPVANNIRSGMASKWTATGRATWSDTQVRMDLAGRDSCVICGLTYWFEAKQPGVHGLLKDRLRNYEIYEIWTKENIKKNWRIRSRFLRPGTCNPWLPSIDWLLRYANLPGSEKYPPGAPRIRPFYWDIAKAYQDERERTLDSDPWEVRKSELPW